MAPRTATAHELDAGIIGTRPAAQAKVLDFGPLFARHAEAPPPPEPPRPVTWTQRYAQLAAHSRDGAKLNELAARVMHALLDVFGSATIW